MNNPVIWNIGTVTIGIAIGLFGTKWLLDKWKEGKPKRDLRDYERGWEWAMSELKKGANPGDLYDKCDNVFDYSMFDKGAKAAIYQWEESRIEDKTPEERAARYIAAIDKIKLKLVKK